MRVFVAGATGVLGRQLMPRLAAAGYEVHGLTRSEAKRGLVEGMGATPIVADALDRDAVEAAVARAKPDVIVHQLTAIGSTNPRRLERDFAATNRLRTEGTDHLLAAGRASNVRRFVAQSHIVTYARTGSDLKREDDAFDPAPARQMRANQQALAHLERAVLSAEWTEGIVLRYGWFYGPGTAMAPGSETFRAIARRRFPLIGDGGGVWSFVHVADAAEATVAAVERGSRGVYNVVDDDPAPVAEWLPELASQLGARPPLRVPRWVGRLAVGEAGVAMMTSLRGASNAKVRYELGWSPAYPTWRHGMTEVGKA